MMTRLYPNQKEKVEIALWLSSQKHKLNASSFLLFLLLLFLPTQLGLHLWPSFALVAGQRLDYLSPTFYLTDILAAGLFFIWFPVFVKHVPLLFLLVFLFLAIGVFISTNPLSGWWQLVKLCEFVFLGWLVAYQKKRVISYLYATCAIGIVAEGTLSFLQFFLHHSLGGVVYFLGERAFSASTPGIANASIQGALVLRPYGTFPHPNVLAGYMVIAGLFMLWSALYRKTRPTLSFLLFFFASCIVLLSLSRLAFVAWLCGIGFMIFLHKKKKKSLFFLLLFAIGILALSPLFLQRIISPFFQSEAFLLRMQLVIASVQIVFAHPVFGVGLGNFFNALVGVMPQLSFSDLQPVHNIFLFTAAETGILGLLIFALVLLQAIKKSIGNVWILTSLLVVVVIGMGDHYFVTLQQGQLLLVLLVGLAFGNNHRDTIPA